jgi:hypothetical protein
MKFIIKTGTNKDGVDGLNKFFTDRKKQFEGVLLEDEFKLHTTSLKQLNNDAEIIDYWFQNLSKCSLFTPLTFDNNSYTLGRYLNRELLFNKEIERLILFENNEFKSTQVLNDFYARINTELYDFDSIKKHSLQDIKMTIKIGLAFSLNSSRFLKAGYDCYRGGNSLELTKKDLYHQLLYEKKRENFRFLYEGYLLAKAKKEIQAFDHTVKLEESNSTSIDKRITVHITAKKFAALLYVLSTKGVFDLAYFNFNRSDYNGEATAKLCRKHFKIISQKGKTKGSEVGLKYIEQAFKKSEIENVLENGVEPLYQALNNLPNLT